MTTSLSTDTTDTALSSVSTMSSEVYRSRAQGGKLWRRLILAVCFIGVVGAVAWASWTLSRSTGALADVNKFTVTSRTFNVVLKEKGELKAAKSTDIICEVEGRSTIITLIPEGTAVKEGDLLVELASDQIEDRIRQEELKETNAITAYESAQTELEIQRDKNASDIRKAELDIELKRLELEKYEKGEWGQMLKDHEIAIDQAEINLRRRTEDFAAAEELKEKDFITKTEYEEDKFNKQRAEWDLAKAKQAIEVLRNYTHVAALRKRQSDLDEATKESARVKKTAAAEELKKLRAVEGKKKELDLTQDELADLRTQKEKTRIAAPTQGFVVYYGGGGRRFFSSEDQIKVGGTVHERQTMLSLPDTSEMLVVLRVHEAKTDKLRLDQAAKITVEGLPGHEFTGTVTKIAVVADTQNRWLNPDLKEYETEITVDSTDAPLKPGVTAHVEILVETVVNNLAVPVQTVYAKGGGRYVFRVQKGKTVAAKVQLGAIGTEWAEIKEGLSAGEKILLAFSDEQKRLIPDDGPADNAKRASRWGNGRRPTGGMGQGNRTLGAGAMRRQHGGPSATSERSEHSGVGDAASKRKMRSLAPSGADNRRDRDQRARHGQGDDAKPRKPSDQKHEGDRNERKPSPPSPSTKP